MAMDVEEMRQDLNYMKVPDFEAIAIDGTGVVETFHTVTRMVINKVQKDLGL